MNVLKFVITLAFLPAFLSGGAEVTLEECMERAEANYPLIAQLDLCSRTGHIDLEDINRGWLPRLSLGAQGTVQNAVPEFPAALQNIMDRLGNDVKGMGRLQYRAGIDVEQMVWDGGQSKARRSVTRAATAESTAAIDAQIYAVCGKVIDLYFGILLFDEQIAQAELTASTLSSNLSRLQTMVANGTALQADADMIEAQMLTTRQQIASAHGARSGYIRMLAIYTGIPEDNLTLTRPAADMPADLSSQRPELKVFDARSRLIDARDDATDATLRPRIGFWAQAFYGYPGFNNFESMMSRNPKFNAVAGLKIAWNIDSFYTSGNSRRKNRIALQQVEADRELFLFNSSLVTAAETEDIASLRELMTTDRQIVALRTKVRLTAESQLRNGVIDATALLTKINEEGISRLTMQLHELQLLQKIYQLKYHLNR